MTALPEPSDAELLEAVGSSSVDPSEKSRAQAMFYARHVRYLYGVLHKQQSKLLALAGIGAEDLVQETFHRAFERAHTFRAADVDDPEHLRRRTRAWLGRVAQHLLADHLERFREVSASPYLERLSCEAIDDAPRPSRELDLITAGLDTLSEREQDVLRITALYHRAGDAQRLPNAVSAELAARWGTTNENIRAIRSRAIKKLTDFVTRGLGQESVP
ncbi:MAG: sigma-70 family RNA polymerase sigma factor [Polyangiaceae bacterium]|nr:sigma-70 family RNA polymerase sigma factor [Polyangiaceae bacterium]